MALCAHHKHDNVDGIVRNEPWVDTERDFVKVCHCELCVKGIADEIIETLRQHYAGTTMQLVASPSPGSTCKRGNSVIINDQVAIIKELDNLGERIDKEVKRQHLQKQDHPEETKDVIKICFGPSCGHKGAEEIEKNLWKKYNKSDEVRVMRCGCTVNCAQANNVVVNDNIINRQSPLRVFNNVEIELSKQRKEKARNSGPLTMDEAEDILGLGF